MPANAEQILFDLTDPVATRVGYMGFGALGALAFNDEAFESVDPRIAMDYGAAYGLVAPLITSLSIETFFNHLYFYASCFSVGLFCRVSTAYLSFSCA